MGEKTCGHMTGEYCSKKMEKSKSFMTKIYLMAWKNNERRKIVL